MLEIIAVFIDLSYVYFAVGVLLGSCFIIKSTARIDILDQISEKG